MEDAQAFDVAVLAALTGGQVALARLGKSAYMRWKSHGDAVSGAAIEVQDASWRSCTGRRLSSASCQKKDKVPQQLRGLASREPWSRAVEAKG